MASRLELSGADRDLLNSQQQETVRKAKQDFANYQDAYMQAQAAQDAQAMKQAQAGMDSAHAAAEAVRAQGSAISQYSGGADGSQYIPLGSLENGNGSGRRYELPQVGYGSDEGASAPSASLNVTGAYRTNSSDMEAQLAAWRQQAIAQAQKQIDYAVNKAVNSLNRQLEDAQPQFREQAEGVSREERQAMDNSALYSELRGDKGGIGKSQYDEIQAQAAANRLAVQQAQTKLATDTARQIEDLRAQGEFDKADAALQISQQYLTQLVDIQQWAANYNLSADQFEASLQQWQAEYDAAMYQFKASNRLNYAQMAQNQNQFNTSMKYNYDQMNYQQQQDALNRASNAAAGMLQNGIMPTPAQLSAYGITEAQATQLIMQFQLEQEAARQGSGSSSGRSSSSRKSSSGSGSSSKSDSSLAADAVAWAAQTGGNPEDYVLANYKSRGYASQKGALSSLNVYLAENKQQETAKTTRTSNSTSKARSETVRVPYFGTINYDDAERLVSLGYLRVSGTDSSGNPIFTLIKKPTGSVALTS